MNAKRTYPVFIIPEYALRSNINPRTDGKNCIFCYFLVRGEKITDAR